MHIDQSIEYLCDWSALIVLSRKDGEPFIEISATIEDYEYRSVGTKIEPIVESMVKSIEKQTKMKYTRRTGGGRRK